MHFRTYPLSSAQTGACWAWARTRYTLQLTEMLIDSEPLFSLPEIGEHTKPEFYVIFFLKLGKLFFGSRKHIQL